MNRAFVALLLISIIQTALGIFLTVSIDPRLAVAFFMCGIISAVIVFGSIKEDK